MAMMQGSNVKLHKGTVCHLRGSTYDGAICMVEAYIKEKAKWQVKLQGAEHKNKQLLVPEDRLRMAFCLIPTSPARFESYVAIEDESTQGACGRGLCAGQRVPAGAPVLEEVRAHCHEAPARCR